MSEFQSIAEIIGALNHPKRPQLHLVSAQPMSLDNILRWGDLYHWPRLVLAEGEALKPGRDAWEELIASNDYVRLASVSERIAKWEQLERNRS
jgi:hypothetical protein